MENNLAIIIPAYKPNFLRKTLQALANQSDKRFNLYVGNDGGSKEIKTMVDEFPELKIHYTFFEHNRGKQSLVQQWERCMEMIGKEEWIWILPDDDFPDDNCVAIFYENLRKSLFDIFRFNVKYVNEKDEVFKMNEELLPVQSSFDSLIEKLSFKRSSSIAEYIFARKKIIEIGGFAEIPLAWGTDDLLWFQLGFEKGIHSTNAAKVSLRNSKFNISGNYKELATEKINANFIFFRKLIVIKEFQQLENKEREKFIDVSIKHIMYNLQDFKISLPFLTLLKFSIHGNSIWGGGVLKNMRRFYLNNKRIKSHA